MLVHLHTDISLTVQIALTLPGVREGMVLSANNLPPRLGAPVNSLQFTTSTTGQWGSLLSTDGAIMSDKVHLTWCLSAKQRNKLLHAVNGNISALMCLLLMLCDAFFHQASSLPNSSCFPVFLFSLAMFMSLLTVLLHFFCKAKETFLEGAFLLATAAFEPRDAAA